MTQADAPTEEGQPGVDMVDSGGRNTPVPPSRIRAIQRIALREYRIAVRGRWAMGLTVLFAVFSVTVVLFGTAEVGPDRYGSIVASLVELSVYLLPLAALVVGYDTVVGAEATGSLNMLFALPVSRSQVIVGKFLGRATVLCLAIVIGLAMGGASALVTIGPGGLRTYATFVLIAILTATVFLGVSVLLSALASKKTQALGATLVAWLWFVLLHDLASLGLIAALDLPDTVITAMVVTNPLDVFRLLVLTQLETSSSGFAVVLEAISLSPAVLLVTLIGWLFVPVGLTITVIRRQTP